MRFYFNHARGRPDPSETAAYAARDEDGQRRMDFGEAFGVYSRLNTHDDAANYNQRGAYNEMDDFNAASRDKEAEAYGGVPNMRVEAPSGGQEPAYRGV